MWPAPKREQHLRCTCAPRGKEEEEERGYWELGNSNNKEELSRGGRMEGWKATLEKMNRQVRIAHNSWSFDTI